jgi:hypothetical protein
MTLHIHTLRLLKKEDVVSELDQDTTMDSTTLVAVSSHSGHEIVCVSTSI